MAKIRDLKRIINNELSYVIEECYLWQLVNGDEAIKAEDVIDEAILNYDKLIERVNQDSIENKKAHFQSVKSDLKSISTELLEKLTKL